MDCLLKLDNEQVSVSVFPDATLAFTDRKTNVAWQTNTVVLQDYGQIVDERVWARGDRSFCDYYPGRFKAEKIGHNRIRAKLFGRLNEEMGWLNFRLELDGPWIVLHIDEIDDRLPSLVFPGHVHLHSLILPSGMGQRKTDDNYHCHFMLQSGLTQRWFGGLKEDRQHGFMAIYDDGVADSGLYAKGLRVAPAWLKSMGQWSPHRSIRYRCTTNGYVGMAKIFRQFAKDRGFFRSLKDKIAERPAVAAMHGGRIISFFQSFTDYDFDRLELLHPWPHMERRERGSGKIQVDLSHADVAQIIADAKSLGMKRGVFNLRGTFNGGYDHSHPDIWPPEPALGSFDELRGIMSENGHYVSVLHDNYQDFYANTKSFPRGVIQMSNGRLMPGGLWHGGQCYITNPKAGCEYAIRNWEQLKTLGTRGVFVDTMAFAQPYEDYHPEYRLNREGTYYWKLQMMEFFRQQGLVLGSENAGDFCMAHLDFLENRHTRRPLTTPPLWQLVFHDAGFCSRYPGGNTSTIGAAGDTCDILWGYAIMWAAGSPLLWRQNREAFRKSLFVDEWHARVGLAEMTNHRYLTEDGQVEQTEFSTGDAVIANFAAEPRTVEGRTIPADGFVTLT